MQEVDRLKKLGNEQFKRLDFRKAIKYYEEAMDTYHWNTSSSALVDASHRELLLALMSNSAQAHLHLADTASSRLDSRFTPLWVQIYDRFHESDGMQLDTTSISDLSQNSAKRLITLIP